MLSLTILCQLNGGCMGCCGYGFISKNKIAEAIILNTLEFTEIKPQTKEELVQFRERAYKTDLRYGVCRNLINKNGQLLCPLHPLQNNEVDLREKHCDIDHLCATAKEFWQWHPEKQQKFIEFIKQSKIDNITYSLSINDGSLLKAFLEKNK